MPPVQIPMAGLPQKRDLPSLCFVGFYIRTMRKASWNAGRDRVSHAPVPGWENGPAAVLRGFEGPAPARNNPGHIEALNSQRFDSKSHA